MYIIGLTGGIACGKSAVAFELRRYGAATLDIDTVTHELLMPGGLLFDTYVDHFGSYIVSPEGLLNKKLIGEIIFNDENERRWINSVAHPVLLNRVRDFLVESSENGKRLAVLEVPLLFDVGWEKFVDETWAVFVSRSRQIWRLTQRDGITLQQALVRLNAQMSTKEIRKRADVVIKNDDGPRSKLRRQIKAALDKISYFSWR